ncbi:MAG: class I SAM-dependent methyltransferase [Actinobacteria bacterium]|nr:class I SAM-dependent methyltransferase [Actinomycetota bacterium]
MTQTPVPLLIHSLAEFRQLIFECLEAADARRIVEIGGEDGTFTRELLAWGSSRDADVVCIDPSPRAALAQLARDNDRLSLVRQPSVVALESLQPADAYLIDGDHNYFTVHQELQLIWRAASDKPPLILLHDVGWPWGRRDLYYDPDTVPIEARHELTWTHGVTFGEPGVVEGGFRGMGEFSVAVREGGPRNGVLTAVEDFLRDRPELSLSVVPVVFGLGVIFDRRAPYSAPLEEVLLPYSSNPLLQRLEDNRLALYLAVLDLQDQLALVHEEFGALRRTCSGHAEALRTAGEQALLCRDLQVENRALWRRVEEADTRERERAAAEDDQRAGAGVQEQPSPKSLWQLFGGRLVASLRRYA